MSSIGSADRGAGRTVAAERLLLGTFTAAIFLSAFLLFAVQPMFAKMILPRLGGSPAVWSVAMVFFQGMLLAGYAYAHWLTRYIGVRRATTIHLAVLTIAVFAMPIAVAQGWHNPPETGQALWLMGLFAVSVGLPFFAVAGNGPLLQAWFARTGHAQAKDPYFLYGASNIGSFAALLLYPFLFEPVFTLADQSVLWTTGFLALVVAIGAAAILTLKTASDSEPRHAAATTSAALTFSTFCKWIGLAFVPSALLVSVTAHISTDIAAIPLLWIVPLALYLLTFVIAFQRKPIIPHRVALMIVPLLIAPLTISAIRGGLAQNLVVGLSWHLGYLFFAALACHGELVRRRPDAAHLTAFYLSMSFGGVLGGIFSAMLAPAIFSSVIEYPILIVAALVCLPAFWTIAPRQFARDLAIGAAATAILIMPAVLSLAPPDSYGMISYLILVFGVGAIVLTRAAPGMHLAVVISLITLSAAYQPNLGKTETHRSFFGVHKIIESVDGRYRMLLHGTTLHGAERIRNDDGTAYSGSPIPTTYYYTGGALADGIAAVREARGQLSHVAVIGLGTGSMACQRRTGEDWRFYEIDRAVVQIASDATKFRFLASCAPQAPIVVGDARLTLAEVAPGTFDLIVLDAFSSDTVPVHLLTREAIAGYFTRLAPGGVLLFHISNRYMDLAPIVANAAAANGLVMRVGESYPDAAGAAEYRLPSIVAAVARQTGDFGRLETDGGMWSAQATDPTTRPWTDDYSNVLGALLRGPPKVGG
jgi:hypothetical protein